ncbi:MAG: protein kinase, partial [Candidatus Krumholzibacteria bacterium]|nr:protein kinase [Candidatus Krumholzibacteria bacterium]
SVRLERGPLPENEIEKITKQLARGLEYAHEQGIVHRDLKPANVKVSGEGAVKILDFGLARAFTADSVAEGDAESHSYQPTITQALTGSGTILGTAAYMSPEQARGYEVDRRGDIWAFGVILYEMLTGERLFEGETATDTLAAVLHKEPKWDELEGQHPALLLQICRRCLEKDAKQRLRDIGEVRVALEGSGSTVIGLSSAGMSKALSGPDAPRGSRVPWLVAGVLGLALIGAVYAGFSGLLGPRFEPQSVVRSSVILPPGLAMNLMPTAPGPVQVSPDGRYLCFAGADTTGRNQLMVRHLGEGWLRPINGTDGVRYPFWSADSREVGFISGDGKLMRVPINGGPAMMVAQATNGKGGSWNQFGEILYAPTHTSSIMMVSESGGESVDLTHLAQDKEVRSHRLPQWLPDGRHFQYIAVHRNSQSALDCTVRIVEAATGKSVDVMPSQSNVLYANGHLLYPYDGVLMARPLSSETFEFTGPAFPLQPGVAVIRAAHLAAFSVNETGVLAYSGNAAGLGTGPLMRFDSSGEEIGPLGKPVMTFGFNFSADGRFMCMGLPNDRSGTFDIWQLDIERGLSTRLTFNSESEWMGVYSPDGKSLILLSDQVGHSSIYRIPSTGGGTLEPLVVNDEDNYPGSFSPDGQTLYFSSADSLGLMHITFLDLPSGEIARLHPSAQYSERFPMVSPNGQWLLYVSSETGGGEIFVEKIGAPGVRWRVSASGGTHPQWSPQGDVIYYFNGVQAVLAVPVEIVAGGLQFGAAKTVLTGLESSFVPTYTVDPSSGDLVGKLPSFDGMISSLELITNWQQLLNQD